MGRAFAKHVACSRKCDDNKAEAWRQVLLPFTTKSTRVLVHAVWTEHAVMRKWVKTFGAA